VPLINRKTAEQKAADRLLREQRQEAEAREKEKAAFFASPAGRARLAYERGDHVFQYEYAVRSSRGVIVALAAPKGTTIQKTADPTAILNSVCAEGWDLVNGSFVFLETGQLARTNSRHKVGIGEKGSTNIAISGEVVGYYLFKRNEANKQELINPWDANDLTENHIADAPAYSFECDACGAGVPANASFCPHCGEHFEAAT